MISYEQNKMVKWDIKKKKPKNGVFKANYGLKTTIILGNHHKAVTVIAKKSLNL